MKKRFALLLTFVLAASLATEALAATNFSGSPSQALLPDIDIELEGMTKVEADAPEELKVGEYCVIEKDNTVIVAVKEDAACLDELIVAPYSKKAEIPEDCPQDRENMAKAEKSQRLLDAAYRQITEIGEGRLTSLPANPSVDFAGDLTKAAQAAGATVNDICISDLFDITYYHTGDTSPGHEETHRKKYTIKVGEEILQNFVALIHRHSGGTDSSGVAWSGEQWNVVPGVEVNAANRTIRFTIKDVHTDLSPFAIVVKKPGSGHIDGLASPKTADPVSFAELGMAMAASVGGIVVLNRRKHD